MEILSPNDKYDFMKYRLVAFVLSLALLGTSLFAWFQSGDKKYGIDFLGGTDVLVRFQNSIDSADIQKRLTDAGIKGVTVLAFEQGDKDFSIRVRSQKDSELAKSIREVLSGIEGNSFELLQEDFVGPIIGAKIRQDGLTAMFFALVCILIYISFRFEWRFALGAIAALVHDVVITVGIFIISGRELNAAVLAALLTIIGYSLNDTIVVYDRMRENLNLMLRKEKKNTPKKSITFLELVNGSINQTLSRTLLTSATTLFVVTTLWLMGGGAVVDLAFTLVVGVMIGTYSSIFVACPTILALEPSQESS